jgi:hypothetical protein
MAEIDALKLPFAAIDAIIAAAEAEAATLPPLPEATDADLPEQERLEVRAVRDLIFYRTEWSDPACAYRAAI